MPRGEREQGDAGRCVRRRVGTPAADAWLHAAGQGSNLCVWEQRRAEAKERATEQQRRVSAIQQKLDKLDEAFLYSESIDVTTYGRQRDKLREALTMAKIDHHAQSDR